MRTDISSSENSARSVTANSDEQEIRHLVYAWVEAQRNKDVSGMMDLYTDSIVSFSPAPPHSLHGKDAIREITKKWFDSFEGSLIFGVSNLHVLAGSDVAFAHALTKIGGTPKDKSKRSSSSWLRVTLGLKKVDGHWLIDHEQLSAPYDMETGHSVTSLSKEKVH